MNLRNFLIGIIVSFSLPWLAVVIVPYFQMAHLEPVAFSEETDGKTGYFIAKRSGRVADGARIYAANGCYQCHTQLVRPTYAGSDLFRPDWGGVANDEVRGDTRRETNAFDFNGETFAMFGVSRMGPDLSNVARRVEVDYAPGVNAEKWFLLHLYNPRYWPERNKSTCPPFRFLFKKRPIRTGKSDHALPVTTSAGYEVVPTPEAWALVSYLASLKKDHQVPAAMNYASKARKETENSSSAP